MMFARERGPRRAGVSNATAAGALMAILATLPCTAAKAQVTTIELPTGGLLLTKGDGIELRSEELYVSPKQVRTSYRFRNVSPKETTSLVVFPMPDITVTDTAANIPIPSEDPQNLLAATTQVDGVTLKTNVLQKAFAKGTDHTADLERMKIPLAPHLRSTDKALGKVPPADGDELARKGLATVEEYSAGAGLRKQLSPRWTLRTTHYWEQKFPVGKDVAIEHRYAPSVGRTAHTALGDPEAEQEGWFKEYVRKYCLDRDFLAAVERAREAARSPRGAPFSEERITYLLSERANLARPIGEFRLVVDTGDPNSLVSFCGDGVKKIGPGRFEMRKSDFAPNRDLHILILKKARSR